MNLDLIFLGLKEHPFIGAVVAFFGFVLPIFAVEAVELIAYKIYKKIDAQNDTFLD